jgi:CheY-like chemotaxis protein
VDEGLAVIGAEGGQISFELLKTSRPRFILLDMVMLGMTGTDFLARLLVQREWATIPVVFMTASTPPHADGAVQKPFVNKDYLLVRIREAIAHWAHASDADGRE